MRIGLRPLYDWAVRQAQMPYAPILLFCMALIEPCFVPLPPDALLVPMALAQRRHAFRMAAIATLGSVIGGMLSYAIGAFAMDIIGTKIVETYHWQAGFAKFDAMFQTYGVWIILIKGLTPVPYMFVTLASGIAHYNFGIFVVACAISRGCRFFLEGTLIYFFGDPIRIFIERYLTLVCLLFLAVLLGGFWVALR